MDSKLNSILDQINSDAPIHGSIPFWSWNDLLEEGELRRQIRDMKALGMRGFFMHARGGLETEYMSEAWFDAVRVCVDEAKKLGMEAWAYDENGWPSGFAGGELLKDPKNHACGLVCETVSEFPPESEDLLGVYAVSELGAVRLVAPNGSDEYVVIRRERDFSYVDTMNPEVTEKFIQATHERYLKELGDDFGKTMPGFFTDEPQYFRWGTPWSDSFLTTFQERFDYDVLENLPAIFMDYRDAEIYRYDYFLHCSRSYYEGFMKPIYDWCEAHGVQLTGHGIEEWSLGSQMNCCGGIMPFYLYQHLPGIDYLGRDLKNVSGARQMGSVCEQTGKKVALSETFAGCGWDVSPRELKQIAELQMAGGVNLVCEHLYAYSARGERKRDYPHHFSEHSPWHGDFNAFETHFQRLGAALSQGRELADVLVIHPIRSAYLHFKKTDYKGSVRELDQAFSQMVEKLSRDQVSYHFGDETVMREMGYVDGNRICVGKCTYKCVVLPVCETLDYTTVAMLREYLAAGGKLYLWDQAPTRVDGRPSDLSFLKSNVTYDEVRAASGVSVFRDGEGVPLHMQLRVAEDRRMIFLANTSAASYPNTEIRLENCNGLAELCLETMETRPLRGKKNSDGSVTVLYDFENSASCLLIETEEDQFLPFERSAERAVVALPRKFRLVDQPENAMILDQAQISRNGEPFGEVLPWSCIRDTLFEERFEGKLTLRFAFSVRELPQKLVLVAEPLQGMQITVNGNSVEMGGDWRIDRRFLGADIASLTRIGENEILLTVDYFQRDDVYRVLYGGGNEALRNCLTFDTEIEPIYLFGGFRVYSQTPWQEDADSRVMRNAGPFVLTAQDETVDFGDVVRDGFAFFTGKMTGETVLDYREGDPTLLALDGRFATCAVEINGEDLGVQLFSDRFDLKPYLKEGENRLRLTLCFSNRNLLGPHHRMTAEPQFVGPVNFSFEKNWKNGFCERFRYDYSFIKWGIGFSFNKE